MKRIGFLNTSVMTGNQGDYIIVDSVRAHLREVLDDAFVIEMPTHSPLFRKGQFGLRPHRNGEYQMLRGCDFSLLAGTNILTDSMRHRWNLWKINRDDAAILHDVVAVGIGSGPSKRLPDRFTRDLYRSIFSREFIHSTRDEKSKRILEACGLRAINTGCATMWSLTDEHCTAIPADKADSVVVTLTDYAPDPMRDSAMLEAILRNYDRAHLWIQGWGDEEYLKSLGFYDRFELIAPSLAAYDAFLETTQCDFVGTRLHAGIRAMQKSRRALIIGVDNRVGDMVETFHLNHLLRSDIGRLEDVLVKRMPTNVRLDTSLIAEFKEQFS